MRRAEAGPALRDPVPRLPHRPLPGAVRRIRLEGGLPADHRAGHGVPLGRDAADPARARAEDAGGRGGRALRGGGALPQPPVRGAAPGRAAGGGQARGRDGRRDRHRRRGRPGRGAGLPAPRRQADRPVQLPPRERRRAGSRRRCSRRSCLEYYGSSPSVPPQIVVPQGVGDTSRAGGVPLGAARLARRGARGRARREAPARRSSPSRTRGIALESDAVQSEQRRLRRVEALEELREALNLESLPIRIECFDISNLQSGVAGRLDGRVPGRGRRRSRTTASSASAASTARTTSRRWRRWSRAASRGSARRDGRRVRRVVRGDAEPRRHRRRQGPALGRARGDAGVRPAARRGDRAREARGGGLPARATRSRSSSTAHSPALQLLQRIRDEAHRFALDFHRQRRDAAREGVDLRHAQGRRARRAGAR